MCASDDTVTLLDINNSVPKYIYDEDIIGKYGYTLTDTFMGYHCGNTPQCKMCSTVRSSVSLSRTVCSRMAESPTLHVAPLRAI